VVGGLLGILGGLVGGVVALVGNYWLETQRWEREKRSRFQQDRLQLYTEFYCTASAIVRDWYADGIEDVPGFYISKEEYLYPKLLQDLIPRLEVMAPSPVRKAANEFDHEIYRAATGEVFSLHDHADTLQRHLDDFVRAARADLGVPLGQVQSEESNR
jgi:hypothetical protein